MMAITLLFILLPFVVSGYALESAENTKGAEYSRQLKTDWVPEKNIYLGCDKTWRLPGDLTPTRYEITLRIDPHNIFFNGTVKIDMRCNQDTDVVVLHSKQLNLRMDKILIKIRSVGGSNVPVTNITFNEEREMVYLQLKASLVKGTSYVLKIRDFVGKIQDEEKGLFRKTYKENGKKRYIVGSQLEHTFARTVFPCFDEPHMKATFTVKIARPAMYRSFSNMPLKNSTAIPQNRYLDTFQETVLLPTYTVAVVVANYSSYPKNGTEFTRILAPENDLKYMDQAFRVATAALRELQSFIKVPTPLSKVDHISLPDFAQGGMENWGLIMYQYDYMVKEENMLSLSTQEGFTFMAHELAHIWFGNIVTVDWWSYVWLNEGFSTYLQFYVTDKIFPKWHLLDQFLISQFQIALKADADPKRLKPALTSPVCSTKNIGDIPDEISYCKGASILRMFIAILGKEEIFQEAMKLYLESRSMKTVKPADWFQVLDEVVHKLNESILPENITFGHVGMSWTEQAGFPLITVTRNYTSTSNINIKQDRFFEYRSKNDLKQTQKEQWWVPLTWTTASSQNISRNWLQENKSVPVIAQKNEWLLFNINATGYYRVNYDDQNWHLLSQGLQSSRGSIPALNRAQLLDDAFSLAFAHRLSLGTALNLTRFLKDEDDEVVWMSACKQFQHVYELVGSTPAYPKVQKYVQRLLRKTYRRVRLQIKPDEPHLDKILRFFVAPIACLFGLEICLTDAQSALSQFLADMTSDDEHEHSPELHPDIESTVLCGGVQSGEKETFEQLRTLAMDEHIPGTDHTASYLSALSCTNDDDLLVWHLNDIFDNNTHFDADESAQAFKHVIDTAKTFSLAFEYLHTNINKINHHFEHSQNMTEDLVIAIIQQIRTTDQYDELHEWIVSTNENDLGDKRKLLEHLESRKLEVDWSNDSVQQITDWLKTSAATFSKENATAAG